MESSFFYCSGKEFFFNYCRQTRRYGAITAVPHGDLPGEDSEIAGYSVGIDLQTADENTRIIVPETDRQRPIEMLRIRVFAETFEGVISPVKYICIPASVKFIEISFGDHGRFNIFNGCTVGISPDNPYFCVYGHGVYSKDMSELYFIFSPNEVFTVPDGVKTIKNNAGLKIKGIKKLIVPKSVEKIEYFAFSGGDIEEAEISAKKIKNSAFTDNIHLKKLTISDFGSIGSTVFVGCTELTTVIAKNAKKFDLNILHGITDKLGIVYSDCESVFDSWISPGVNMQRLMLSPNVKNIGKNIIRDGFLDIISANNELNFSYKDLLRASELGAIVTVHCAETGDILYRIDTWFSADGLYNGSGTDIEYCKRITQYNGVYEALSDACGYYKQHRGRADFKKNLFKPLRQFVHDLSAAVVWGLTADGDYEKLSELQCFDFISSKHFHGLIGYSAKQGKTDITALLMQRFHEREQNCP